MTTTTGTTAVGQRRWTIRVDEELADVAEALAKVRDTSVNQMVVDLVEEMVEEARHDPELQEKAAAALDDMTRGFRRLLE